LVLLGYLGWAESSWCLSLLSNFDCSCPSLCLLLIYFQLQKSLCWISTFIQSEFRTVPIEFAGRWQCVCVCVCVWWCMS
jgi:hypothetical protein